MKSAHYIKFSHFVLLSCLTIYSSYAQSLTSFIPIKDNEKASKVFFANEFEGKLITPPNRHVLSFSLNADSIVQTKYHSVILNEDRPVIIHLPRNYFNDPIQKFTVMYVLDGLTHDKHTADKITVLSDAGVAPNAIVVGISNLQGNRRRDLIPPFMKTNIDDDNSPFGSADKFLKFIEEELIPYIDKNYRTSDYKTLSGWSAGGLFVLYSLIERPDLFQSRFCYSAPVWRHDSIIVKKTVEFIHSSSEIKTFLFLSVGANEEKKMLDGYAALIDALNKSRKKHFKWVSYITPYAIHGNNTQISTSKGLIEWAKYLKNNK